MTIKLGRPFSAATGNIIAAFLGGVFVSWILEFSILGPRFSDSIQNLVLQDFANTSAESLSSEIHKRVEKIKDITQKHLLWIEKSQFYSGLSENDNHLKEVPLKRDDRVNFVQKQRKFFYSPDENVFSPATASPIHEDVICAFNKDGGLFDNRWLADGISVMGSEIYIPYKKIKYDAENQFTILQCVVYVVSLQKIITSILKDNSIEERYSERLRVTDKSGDLIIEVGRKESLIEKNRLFHSDGKAFFRKLPNTSISKTVKNLKTDLSFEWINPSYFSIISNKLSQDPFLVISIIVLSGSIPFFLYLSVYRTRHKLTQRPIALNIQNDTPKKKHISLDESNTIVLLNDSEPAELHIKNLKAKPALNQKDFWNLTPVYLVALNKSAEIEKISKTFAELLTDDIHQAVGKNWFKNFVSSDIKQNLLDEFQRTISDSKSFPDFCEYNIVNRDRELRLISWNNVTLFDDSGKPCGVIAHGRDITEIKRQHNELKIVALAFESKEAQLICDAYWKILRTNSSLSNLFGRTQLDSLGRHPLEVLGNTIENQLVFKTISEELQQVDYWEGELKGVNGKGEIFPCLFRVKSIRERGERVSHYLLSVEDITEKKRVEDKFLALAFYDPLTNLPNRRLLQDRLKIAISSGLRHGRLAALLFVDLDNFKNLNDTRGHDVGDQLLIKVAERLKDCVRKEDTVARLGGDEFVVMLENLALDRTEALVQAEAVGLKVLKTLGKPYPLGGRAHISTPSIGVTLFGDIDEGIEEPLKRADVAMYESKAAGRNTLCVFDPSMQRAVAIKMELEDDLRLAIEMGQLSLHFQPQVQSKPNGDLVVIGAEALIRWKHPARGLVPPGDFIPLAEETGLIVSIGKWVIEAACTQLVKWKANVHLQNLTLAVNVSASQFLQKDFVSHIQKTLEASGAPAYRLKLELTEGVLVSDVTEITKKMTTLQSWGVGFALDDFGTGYSSLSYLKRLPLDVLKIDQSFVRDVFDDVNSAAIAGMIVALGRSIGLTVIAEGVETEEQRYFLAQQGCHFYQGYLFGKPLSEEKFYDAVTNLLLH